MKQKAAVKLYTILPHSLAGMGGGIGGKGGNGGDGGMKQKAAIKSAYNPLAHPCRYGRRNWWYWW